MSYPVQFYTPPPLPQALVGARDFHQLRESVKVYLSLLTKFHSDTFQTLVHANNQGFQGLGETLASAATITITQSIHVITGTATITRIKHPPDFGGSLILISQDGFKIAEGGVSPGALILTQPTIDVTAKVPLHLTHNPLDHNWYADLTGGAFNGTTAPTHGVLVGEGTNPLVGILLTNGQLLIGSTGNDPVAALPTGTANQVTVTPGAGTLAFSLPTTITGPTRITGLNAPTVAGDALSEGRAIGGVTPAAGTFTAAVAATAQITTSVLQGGGLKHQRVTTGAVGASSDADVTLTWSAAFADTNYSPVASVIDGSGKLRVVCVKTVNAGSVVVTVHNDDAGGAHTGTLAVIALHD